MARLCTTNKPLTAILCVLLSLLISLCSATNKGGSKSSGNKVSLDKSSFLNQKHDIKYMAYMSITPGSLRICR